MKREKIKLIREKIYLKKGGKKGFDSHLNVETNFQDSGCISIKTLRKPQQGSSGSPVLRGVSNLHGGIEGDKPEAVNLPFKL